MAIATWQPSTIYLPGALVVPTTQSGAAVTSIPNQTFEGGDTDWTKGTGWAINTTKPFAGTYSAEFTGTTTSTLVSSTKVAVQGGKAITAQCFIHQGPGIANEPNASIILEWYDSGDALISTSVGNNISDENDGIWKASTVSGTAPSNAASVSIGVTATGTLGNALYVDNFTWNYVTGTAPSTLVYKAIQTESGLSGATEPTWPTVISQTVVDNEVTWEAAAANTVTWEASSVLTSGSSEPTWPTEAGAYIIDNNIAWKTVPLRIEDEHCPNTKVVAIAASKVFAGDVDIVRFCATLNARDWTTEDDAGYLPTGLQQKGQVGVDAMGVYRGNLAVWSPSTFQVWQVDPDPAAMALLDAMEGVGSTHQQAVQPVSNDLFFLAALGVRTVSIAAGANNLATGDAGVPIDTLVQAEVNVGDVEPIATYYPSAGQYWLAFRPLTIAGAILASQFLLTSQLYPIESTEYMNMACTCIEGTMRGAEIESADVSVSALDGELKVIKLSDGPYIEAADLSVAALDGELKTIKLSFGPEVNSADTSVSALDGTLEDLLVTVRSPDEAMEFDCVLIPGDCSMDAV